MVQIKSDNSTLLHNNSDLISKIKKVDSKIDDISSVSADKAMTCSGSLAINLSGSGTGSGTVTSSSTASASIRMSQSGVVPVTLNCK